MHLEISWSGNREECLKQACTFLDDQIFKYPQFQVLIAGVRGSVVGQLQNVARDAQGSLAIHVFADGSMIDTNVTVKFTGVSL